MIISVFIFETWGWMLSWGEGLFAFGLAKSLNSIAVKIPRVNGKYTVDKIRTKAVQIPL